MAPLENNIVAAPARTVAAKNFFRNDIVITPGVETRGYILGSANRTGSTKISFAIAITIENESPDLRVFKPLSRDRMRASNMENIPEWRDLDN
jgi:hypothetical protein